MKKITLGKALGTIAVLCLLWVSIMLTIGFCEHYETSNWLIYTVASVVLLSVTRNIVYAI